MLKALAVAAYVAVLALVISQIPFAGAIAAIAVLPLFPYFDNVWHVAVIAGVSGAALAGLMVPITMQIGPEHIPGYALNGLIAGLLVTAAHWAKNWTISRIDSRKWSDRGRTARG